VKCPAHSEIKMLAGIAMFWQAGDKEGKGSGLLGAFYACTKPEA
jgi:hypothetical protein